MRPHRRQPTRLPRLWDSPGKNSGVGCHFLLQCMKVKCESEVSQSCLTLSDPMDCSPPGSSVHGIFQARVLEWGAIAFSQLLTLGGIKQWEIRQRQPLVYRTQHHPAVSSTAGRLIQTTSKTKIQTQVSADRITTSLSPVHKRKAKRKTKNNSSPPTIVWAQITPYKKFTQTTRPTSWGQKPKGEKNSTLKPGIRRHKTQ